MAAPATGSSLLDVLRSPKQRLRVSLILTVVMVLGLGAFRWSFYPRDDTGLPPSVFWGRKLTAPAADVVIMGTSRANNGIVPELLAERLGSTVNNFAFGGGHFSDAYLDAVNARLDGRPGQTLLIAPTPFAVSVEGEWADRFVATQKRAERSSLSRWLHGETEQELLLISDVHRFFGTMELGRAMEGIGVRPPENSVHAEWTDTGWAALDRPVNLPGNIVDRYNDIFSSTQADPQRIDALVRRVRYWTDHGVSVCFLRMPISRQVAYVEMMRSGFDWEQFRAATEEAGARWLDLGDLAEFETIDGSHLSRAEAVRFTERVATALSSSHGG